MSITLLHCSVLPFVDEGRSNVRRTDGQGAGESDRDYLNGLVEASVANTANQVMGKHRGRSTIAPQFCFNEIAGFETIFRP